MNITPFIDEHFDGVIWRMEIDELTETIFVEVRDHEEKKVHFGSVDLRTGKPNFKGYTTPERWLTGIETAYDRVLLLHNYQSESGPVHKGLIAIDALTADVLWSNYNFCFDYLSAQGPVLYDSRFQPRKLFLTDIKTGAAIHSDKPLNLAGLQTKVIVPGLMAKTEFLQMLPLEAFGDTLHYLKFNNYIIVSLHALKDGQLNQLLFIIYENKIIYQDLLNTGIQKLQPESFILHKNHLIYLKNKSELKVLSL